MKILIFLIYFVILCFVSSEDKVIHLKPNELHNWTNPGYPEPYKPSEPETLRTNFTAPEGYIIKLTVVEMDIRPKLSWLEFFRPMDHDDTMNSRLVDLIHLNGKMQSVNEVPTLKSDDFLAATLKVVNDSKETILFRAEVVAVKNTSVCDVCGGLHALMIPIFGDFSDLTYHLKIPINSPDCDFVSCVYDVSTQLPDKIRNIRFHLDQNGTGDILNKFEAKVIVANQYFLMTPSLIPDYNLSPPSIFGDRLDYWYDNTPSDFEPAFVNMTKRPNWFYIGMIIIQIEGSEPKLPQENIDFYVGGVELNKYTPPSSSQWEDDITFGVLMENVTLQSPYYPDSYPINKTMIYKIKQGISFCTIEYFDLGPNTQLIWKAKNGKILSKFGGNGTRTKTKDSFTIPICVDDYNMILDSSEEQRAVYSGFNVTYSSMADYDYDKTCPQPPPPPTPTPAPRNGISMGGKVTLIILACLVGVVVAVALVAYWFKRRQESGYYENY